MVIKAYLDAYGPTTPETFDRWLSLNTSNKPKLRGWFTNMRGILTEVNAEGRKALMLTEHVEDLTIMDPWAGVRPLGGFDQHNLGPDAKDDMLLPQKHRSAVSRTSGWISPIVVLNGKVAEVWLEGLAVLHAAEAHAMFGRRRECERTIVRRGEVPLRTGRCCRPCDRLVLARAARPVVLAGHGDPYLTFAKTALR